MGSNYLCRTEKARHPFYIESLGLNIYTIEELCYYLKQYIYMIDDTILNEKLCNWLGEELQMDRLQRLLMRSLERNETPLQFIMPIFQECGYLEKEEIQKFQEQISDIQIEQEDIRRKMKADYLLGFGLYVNALTEYEKIFASRSPGRLGIQFYAQVLNSMASAYARLFCFEEAANCLWESYQSMRSRKTYETYLRLLPLYMTEQQYYQRLEEIRVNEEDADRLRSETELIFLEAHHSELEERWSEMEDSELLEEFKTSYVRNTTGSR